MITKDELKNIVYNEKYSGNSIISELNSHRSTAYEKYEDLCNVQESLEKYNISYDTNKLDELIAEAKDVYEKYSTLVRTYYTCLNDKKSKCCHKNYRCIGAAGYMREYTRYQCEDCGHIWKE